jgi:hypothetical protein
MVKSISTVLTNHLKDGLGVVRLVSTMDIRRAASALQHTLACGDTRWRQNLRHIQYQNAVG